MRCVYLATAALLAMTTLAALAQAPPVLDPATGARAGHAPGIGDSLPRSDKAPPTSIGENAGPYDYLRAARASLVAGRTGQAQQSLEMAETRALDRSVAQNQASVPIDSQFVTRISDARHALGDGNSAHAIELIDLALSS